MCLNSYLNGASIRTRDQSRKNNTVVAVRTRGDRIRTHIRDNDYGFSEQKQFVRGFIFPNRWYNSTYVGPGMRRGRRRRRKYIPR